MIFDLYMPKYTLLKEDNSGPDDPTQQQNQQQQNNQDQNTTNQDTENQNADEENQDEDEYTMTDPDEEDAETDDNQNQDDQTDDENQDEDEYTMTDPDEEGNADEDDNTDQDTNDNDTSDENDPSAKLKELEKSIFDQLSPELQQSKTIELKKLYTITYEKCQSIIDTLGTIEKEPSKVKVYDYILNSLLDLQKYINDYLTNIFDSKTYIENMTELQKYLAILDTVNGVFEEMSKSVPDGK